MPIVGLNHGRAGGTVVKWMLFGLAVLGLCVVGAHAGENGLEVGGRFDLLQGVADLSVKCLLRLKPGAQFGIAVQQVQACASS